MTSKLQEILAESKKIYPFKIGIAGDLSKVKVADMVTVLQIFVVEKMSSV